MRWLQPPGASLLASLPLFFLPSHYPALPPFLCCCLSALPACFPPCLHAVQYTPGTVQAGGAVAAGCPPPVPTFWGGWHPPNANASLGKQGEALGLGPWLEVDMAGWGIPGCAGSIAPSLPPCAWVPLVLPMLGAHQASTGCRALGMGTPSGLHFVPAGFRF